MKDYRLCVFLVFKLIKWDESSSKYVQTQGKCLLVIRRVLLSNDGLIMKDNDDYQRQSKTIKDNQRTIKGLSKDYQRTIDCFLGTFLVLEAIQEYENSGKWIRMKGKYLSLIRRHILLNGGLSSGNNE